MLTINYKLLKKKKKNRKQYFKQNIDILNT